MQKYNESPRTAARRMRQVPRSPPRLPRRDLSILDSPSDRSPDNMQRESSPPRRGGLRQPTLVDSPYGSFAAFSDGDDIEQLRSIRMSLLALLRTQVDFSTVASQMQDLQGHEDLKDKFDMLLLDPTEAQRIRYFADMIELVQSKLDVLEQDPRRGGESKDDSPQQYNIDGINYDSDDLDLMEETEADVLAEAETDTGEEFESDSDEELLIRQPSGLRYQPDDELPTRAGEANESDFDPEDYADLDWDDGDDTTDVSVPLRF